MSHFTNIQTSFKELQYLEKALNRLRINYKRISLNKKTLFNHKLLKSDQETVSLVIPQLNGYDIQFCWNVDRYELIIDMSFWDQPYPIEIFLDKIAQEYAGEVIVGESHKVGFQPVHYKQNIDGSNTLILERWK